MTYQQPGPPRTDELAAPLPGVRSVEPLSFLFASVLGPDQQPVDAAIAFAGSHATTARLLAGRQPNPGTPNEFVANRQFVNSTHAHIGDHVRLLAWSRDQVAHGLGYVADPKGPPIDGVLVGVIDSPESLQDQYTTLVFPPSLLKEDIGLGLTISSVRLDPGVSTSRLRAELDGLPGGDQLGLDRGSIVSSDVATAIEAQARGIWLMAAVAAVAAVITLGQILSRHAQLAAARARSAHRGRLHTGGDFETEAMGRATIPAAGGIVLGMVAATAISGRFPVGFVRPIEPHPGLRIDGLVFALVGGMLFLALLAWVGIACWSRAHGIAGPRFLPRHSLGGRPGPRRPPAPASH